MAAENVHQIACLSRNCPLSVGSKKIRVKGLEWNENVQCGNSPVCAHRKPVRGGNCMHIGYISPTQY